jgi:2-amino-4-hydroxy-6-hydroxymethyldihydropteridine diphosphokinase
MTVAFLAIGSNLGDRESYIQRAIQTLPLHGADVVRVASIYETEPKDVDDDQRWFLNTVVEVRTDLSARELLQACLEIEKQNQRVRSLPKSARTLDIDIVFYGEEVIHEHGLTIPHPRYAERNFVLVPLAEIAPQHRDPRSGIAIAALKDQARDPAAIRKFASNQ